jgi:hypothetical protein
MNDSNEKTNPPELTKWRMAQLAFDLGFVIALPILALGLLGKWLDGKLGLYPALTLLGMLLAIITSTAWLVRKIKPYINKAK